MLSFLAGILIFTFNKTEIATQITVAATSFVVSCLILWCAISAWDMSENTRAYLADTFDNFIMGRQNGLRSHVRRSMHHLRDGVMSIIRKAKETNIPSVDSV